MSGGEVAQIIVASATLLTSLGALVAAVGALLIGWHNTDKIEQVHQATNGLTAKLVTASKSEGNLEGRAELKSEQAVDIHPK